MPAIALARGTGALPVFEMVLLMAGLALTGGGAWPTARGLYPQRA